MMRFAPIGGPATERPQTASLSKQASRNTMSIPNLAALQTPRGEPPKMTNKKKITRQGSLGSTIGVASSAAASSSPYLDVQRMGSDI